MTQYLSGNIVLYKIDVCTSLHMYINYVTRILLIIVNKTAVIDREPIERDD